MVEHLLDCKARVPLQLDICLLPTEVAQGYSCVASQKFVSFSYSKKKIIVQAQTFTSQRT